MRGFRWQARVGRGVVAFAAVGLIALGRISPAVAQGSDAPGKGEAGLFPAGNGAPQQVPAVDPFAPVSPFENPFRLAPPVKEAFTPVINEAESVLHRAGQLQTAAAWNDALKAYDRAVALCPESGQIYRDRGLIQIMRREFDRARRDLDRAVELDPQDWIAFSYRAYLARDSGQGDDRVIAELNAAIRLQPDAHLFRERGDAYAHKKADAQARADYERVVKLDPKDAYCHAAIAMIDSNDGRHREAIARFDRVIALSPNDANGYAYRGWSRALCGELGAAMADWEEAVRINPDIAWVHKWRGAVYCERNDYQQAIAAFDEAQRICPDQRFVLLARANAALEAGAARFALVDLLHLRQLHPDLPCLPFLLARAYDGMGQHDLARAERKRAAEASPESALLGVAIEINNAFERDDLDAAQAACRRLEALDPRHGTADLLRGLILYDQDEIPGAVRALDRALAHERNSVAAYLLRARAHKDLGNTDRALRDLDEAIRLAPGHPVAHYGRGVVHADQGRFREAVDDFSHALQGFAPAKVGMGVHLWLTDDRPGPGTMRVFLMLFNEETAGSIGSIPWPIDRILVTCSPPEIHLARCMAYLRLSDLDKALADGYQAAARLPGSTLRTAVATCAQAAQGQWIASFVRLAQALE